MDRKARVRFVSEKQSLIDLVLKRGHSVEYAAVLLYIDDILAKKLIFTNKPTQNQIDYAMEVYNKGLPVMHACVASGVSFETFKKVRRELAEKEYKPYRW